MHFFEPARSEKDRTSVLVGVVLLACVSVTMLLVTTQLIEWVAR